MSVKTPVFNWDVPVLGEEADVPSDLLSLATEIENTLKALEVKRLKTAGAGDAKKLLIVSATGEPAWRAMSGDATISETGSVNIAAEAVNVARLANLAVTEAKLAGESVATAKLQELAVTAAKLAALAVTEAKIADGAVSSRKFKPTTGYVQSVAAVEFAAGAGSNEKYEDLAETTRELTPLVPSILTITFGAFVGIDGKPITSVNVMLNVDGSIPAGGGVGVGTGNPAGSPETHISIGVEKTVQVALSAAKHTIKLQGVKLSGEASGSVQSGYYVYELVAA